MLRTCGQGISWRDERTMETRADPLSSELAPPDVCFIGGAVTLLGDEV